MCKYSTVVMEQVKFMEMNPMNTQVATTVKQNQMTKDVQQCIPRVQQYLHLNFKCSFVSQT